MEEFVFALPEIPYKTYPLASLEDYDQILNSAIAEWEQNVRCGIVLLYQVEKNGKLRKSRSATPHQSVLKIPLGQISVDDARRKFL
jgi:hypothetical protein